ncbi:MAG TPA: DUF3592 domain-containing protein [Actinomycetota bacterium]|nr:DUF3592 domain-containing protein [Actinomycetota bacterium]
MVRKSSGLIGAIGGFLGPILLVVGMALTIGPTAEARDGSALLDHGVPATGTVIDKTIKTGGRYSSRYAILDVLYTSDIGLPEEVSLPWCGEPEDLSIGDDVPVLYDPDDLTNAGFTDCPFETEGMGYLIVGIVLLVLGTAGVLKAWQAGGWKRRRWPVALAILGLLIAAASFSEDCECREFVYTGGALIILGIVPVVAGRDRVVPPIPESESSV